MVESDNKDLSKYLEEMEDWYRAVIFDSDGTEIAKKNVDKVDSKELKDFLTAMDDRDTTIGKGFVFNTKHFDVHRFHVPLVYGRRGGPEGGPEDCEGICLARIKSNDKKFYLLITYVYPIVSARAISIIPDFLKASSCKFFYISWSFR